MTMDLHQKIEKRNKSRAKNGLLKKVSFCQNKKTNSYTVLPILFEPRKEG
jgi:hypothetical protein